jgi:hypothetical protein
MAVSGMSKNGGFPSVFENVGVGFELPVPHQSRHAHYLLPPVPSEVVLQAGIRLARAAYHPLTLLSNGAANLLR